MVQVKIARTLPDQWGQLSPDIHAVAQSQLDIYIARRKKAGLPIDGIAPETSALACAKLLTGRRNYAASANFCIEVVRNGVIDLDLLQLLVNNMRASAEPTVLVRGVEALLYAADLDAKWSSTLICNFRQLRKYIDFEGLHDRLWRFELAATHSLQDAFGQISDRIDPRSSESKRFPPSLVKFAYEATERHQSREDFFSEMCRSYIDNSYLHFLRQYDDQAFLGEMSESEFVFEARRLIHQVDHHRVVNPRSVVDNAARSGRSIIIARAHGGLNAFGRSSSLGIELPLTVIGRGVEGQNWQAADEHSTIHLSTHGADVAKDFARLLKFMRKSPRIVEVYPDGADGSCQEVAFFGAKVRIGVGAAALAYYGRGDIYFFSTEWKDGRSEIELTPLCVDQQAGSYEEFEDAFVSAYVACLEQIVIGPARHMGTLAEGFWGAFSTTTSDTGARS